ncbi:MAG: dihydrofolate reductase [Lachnospiraceae bacterium]|nr:dihydrofolate reductase [Lachnospiraceae bacterium]MDE6697855.1 dihydrofolate reductase [Lachnospiraceae bacterium]
MNLIVAVDRNWGIGYKNKLLISIPEDMKFFRETTTGNVVVMGKNTLLSFPNGKPLKNRENIVITHDKSFKAEGAAVVNSIEEALEEIKKYNTEDVYVIGGGSIYEQMLPYVDTAYVTYIDFAYQSDTRIPNLDESKEWRLTEESEEQTYFDVEYYFRKYERITPSCSQLGVPSA